jgi:serine/threonine protein kinase
LSLKIKWPKGFSGIARDLISKLLKIDPKQRIAIDQITEHPWFKSIPIIRPVNITLATDNNKLMEAPMM